MYSNSFVFVPRDTAAAQKQRASGRAGRLLGDLSKGSRAARSKLEAGAGAA